MNTIGLPYLHAYTVLGTDQLSNGQKLVKVRNPFGPSRETFHGDWSDKSDLWTDAFKAEVNYEDSNDGVWFISAEDYKSNMQMTVANPDVQNEFQSYQAFFDLKKGETHYETISVYSSVSQRVYVSANIYNN